MGRKIFNERCSGCHNFRTDGIGPQLAGVADRDSAEWLIRFVRDPQAMIGSGDPRAVRLFRRFHTVMPSFADLSRDDLHAVLAFLGTNRSVSRFGHHEGLTEVDDPMPDTIPMSQIQIAIEPLVQMPATSAKRPFTRINKIESRNGVLYVLDLRGKLFAVSNGHVNEYFNLAVRKPKFISEPGLATGFGSFTFHPDFLHNGLLYTTHTEPAHTRKADFPLPDSIPSALQWVLTEWKTASPRSPHFEGESRELMRVDMVAGIHGFQEITFRAEAKKGDADYGLLYIGVGDGGSAENGYPFLAHSTSRIWGSVLRIDPLQRNSRNGRYGVPAQNPFAGDTASAGEIFAYGFRNPNRITWTAAGSMLVANIGQANIESIELVRAGADCGWPLREGSFVIDASGDMTKVYRLPANDSNNHFTYPALQYDHDEGNSVSGGFVYNRDDIRMLKGKYIFGDIVSGRVFMADAASLRPGHPGQINECRLKISGIIDSLRRRCGDHRVDLRFGRDAAGNIYLMTKADGAIYRISGAGMANEPVKH